jgi:hypothetical protein
MTESDARLSKIHALTCDTFWAGFDNPHVQGLLDDLRAILSEPPPTFVCPSCGRLGRPRTPGYKGQDPQCPDCIVKAEAGRARLNAAYSAKDEGTATPEQERMVSGFENVLSKVLVPVDEPPEREQQPATVTLPMREVFIPLPSDPAARLRSLQAFRAACKMRPDMGKMDSETLARIAELEAEAGSSGLRRQEYEGRWTPPEGPACRVMETRYCPASYDADGGCATRPCARFESDDETPWLPDEAWPDAGTGGPC